MRANGKKQSPGYSSEKTLFVTRKSVRWGPCGIGGSRKKKKSRKGSKKKRVRSKKIGKSKKRRLPRGLPTSNATDLYLRGGSSTPI